MIAGYRDGLFGGEAVEALGENPGQGGLPDTPRTGKKVGVAEPLQLDRVDQSGGDVLLPHHLVKLPRTPLDSQCLIHKLFSPKIISGEILLIRRLQAIP